MKNAAMADSAIVALNASEFKGQNIVVEHGRAKERNQGGGGAGGVSGRGGNQGGAGGPRGGRGGGGRGGMLGKFSCLEPSNPLIIKALGKPTKGLP